MKTYVPSDQPELALIEDRPIGEGLLTAPLDAETRAFLEAGPPSEASHAQTNAATNWKWCTAFACRIPAMSGESGLFGITTGSITGPACICAITSA